MQYPGIYVRDSAIESDMLCAEQANLSNDIYMKNRIIVVLVLLLCAFHASAFEEREVQVWSKSMNKNVPICVITPDGYSPTEKYPVIYMLHGYSDNHKSWAKDGVVGRLADEHKVVVVMTDGAYDSWYFDSPVVKEYRYETFIAKELIRYIDSSYSTITHRQARAITGLSMGGHGAFYVAMRNQDVFGNMGSFSGGLDFRPFPENWNIKSRLGSKEEFPERWEEHTVINLTHLLSPGKMNIVFECGSDDFFFKVNCDMHKKLLKEGIKHDFYIRPGGHSWQYWLKNVKYQFMYFADKFAEYSNK